MKKIGLLLPVIALFFAASCADKDAYVVKGTIPGDEFNGKHVYLQELTEDGRGFNSIDTATIEKGVFVFKGKAGDKPQVRFVSVVDAPYRPALFILEKGNIELNIDTVSGVKGTLLNDKYQDLMTKSEAANKKMNALGLEYQNASTDGTLTTEMQERINKEFEASSKEMSTLMFDFAKENIANPVGEFFFMSIGGALEEAQVKELLSKASPEFKKKEQIQELEKHFQLLEMSAIGSQFIDVKGLTPEGKEIILSNYVGKGKVVLIDFWASWCKPCIAEMPTVVEAYKKYKNKGFEIVGISLDSNNEAWSKSIKDLGITWPQMSDLKEWESELSAPYGVNTIPYTILVDKDGKIIEKNLRGVELISKLDELLK